MKLPAWLRLPSDRRLIAAAMGVTAFVAADAASGSYQHQYEQAIYYKQAHWDAGLFPLSVDGMIVAATLVIWSAARKRLGFKRTWPAYLVLLAGIAVTITVNLSPGYPGWGVWLRPGISAWPAVAFVAAYEMTVWLVRMDREDKPAAAGARPALQAAAGDQSGREPASPGLDARPRPVRTRRPAGLKGERSRTAVRSRQAPVVEGRTADELTELARTLSRNQLADQLGCSRTKASNILHWYGGQDEQPLEVNGAR